MFNYRSSNEYLTKIWLVKISPVFAKQTVNMTTIAPIYLALSHTHFQEFLFALCSCRFDREIFNLPNLIISSGSPFPEVLQCSLSPIDSSLRNTFQILLKLSLTSQRKKT